MRDYDQPDPNERSVVKLRTDRATEMLLAATGGKHPGNKYLVIVGHDSSFNHLVAVWSYDAMHFGMVELKFVSKSES